MAASKQFNPRIIKLIKDTGTKNASSRKASSKTVIDVEELTENDLSGEEMGRLFKEYTSNVEIDTDWIKPLSLDFSYRADTIEAGLYDISNLNINLEAQEGVMRLTKFEASHENKPASYTGLIDTNHIPPSFEFSGRLQGEPIEVILGLQDDLLTGGELNGEFELRSEGETLNQLIANLNGLALFSVGPLTINSALLRVVSSDILLSVAQGMLSKEEGKGGSEYQCGVLGIRIKDGVVEARKSFSMQALNYNLAGNGKVDLNTGQVDIVMVPKPRKGLRLSISSLVGGFKIKGYMDTPDIGIHGQGLLTATAMGMVLTPTVASGALVDPYTSTIVATGLVAKGLYDRITAANYTCEKTQNRIERYRSKANLIVTPE